MAQLGCRVSTTLKDEVNFLHALAVDMLGHTVPLALVQLALIHFSTLVVAKLGKVFHDSAKGF